ncbi:ATP phosphoribosyltransferase regulatory subunit [Thioclava sp. GXIMD4215]|uniref:ATP phosphoribosyltransferase regulatory subunit n=1 Tax=Thioclava sp. GXIMD4215 TaxID=3131928 RepID=UPI0032497761
MATKTEARATGQRILQSFLSAGAQEIQPDILQPAEVLLDLYGEDIRARAYVTHDPGQGEMMLRPDFTVPVVQAHMAGGAEPARYCYLGEVFRRQDHLGSARAVEYQQVGYEVFDREDPETADAEVFALFNGLLSRLGLTATIGDLGILRAAVDGLDTMPARKAALSRHIWRPARFQKLLQRYAGLVPVPETRRETLGGMRSEAPWIGLRSSGEMELRISVLKEEAEAAPISRADVDKLDALFALNCAAEDAPAALRALDIPAIAPAIERLETRLAALKARRIDLGALRFDASHGRSTMEYYDGFVFSFATENPDMPPVATGGRYDALTRILGHGAEIPAVGGVIRPGVLADLEAGR